MFNHFLLLEGMRTPACGCAPKKEKGQRISDPYGQTNARAAQAMRPPPDHAVTHHDDGRLGRFEIRHPFYGLRLAVVSANSSEPSPPSWSGVSLLGSVSEPACVPRRS